jgi:hypothetical protein
MVQLKENKLIIEIGTESPAAYLHELQLALTVMIVSVAESPELAGYQDMPESIFKLRELQQELMLSVDQMKRLIEP